MHLCEDTWRIRYISVHSWAWNQTRISHFLLCFHHISTSLQFHWRWGPYPKYWGRLFALYNVHAMKVLGSSEPKTKLRHPGLLCLRSGLCRSSKVYRLWRMNISRLQIARWNICDGIFYCWLLPLYSCKNRKVVNIVVFRARKYFSLTFIFGRRVFVPNGSFQLWTKFWSREEEEQNLTPHLERAS